MGSTHDVIKIFPPEDEDDGHNSTGQDRTGQDRTEQYAAVKWRTIYVWNENLDIYLKSIWHIESATCTTNNTQEITNECYYYARLVAMWTFSSAPALTPVFTESYALSTLKPLPLPLHRIPRTVDSMSYHSKALSVTQARLKRGCSHHHSHFSSEYGLLLPRVQESRVSRVERPGYAARARRKPLQSQVPLQNTLVLPLAYL
jgi:hypothetical protein